MPVANDAVDVAPLGIVHLAGAVRGERLDRDGHTLPDLGGDAIVIVRYGKARVKVILLDLMAAQVHDRPEARSLDGAFDRSSDGIDRRAVIDHFNGDRQCPADAPMRSVQFLVPTSTVAAVSPI